QGTVTNVATGNGLLGGPITGTGTLTVDPAVVAIKNGGANQSFDNGTLFLDYANNRVGVGTTTPTTALDVSGTARASGFRYEPPVTTRLNVHAFEFVGLDYLTEVSSFGYLTA